MARLDLSCPVVHAAGTSPTLRFVPGFRTVLNQLLVCLHTNYCACMDPNTIARLPSQQPTFGSVVQLSARAVFSKYSVTPARALNFGPITYNTNAAPRKMEVTNVGEVSFSLRLFDPAKGLVSYCPACSHLACQLVRFCTPA